MSCGDPLNAGAASSDAQRAPAPWTLRGEGWLLALRLSAGGQADAFPLPARLQGRPVGGVALVMLVDYQQSPVGAYRELLYIPGRFELEDGRRAWSVTRIYVSTRDSVANGRANWGIPKELAEFTREPVGRGERVRVEAGGIVIADLHLEPRGFALPVHAGLLPAAFRRFVQFLDGHRFEFSPAAHGRAGLARLRSARSDPALFPDLASARVLLALRIPRFRLGFPPAEMRGDGSTRQSAPDAASAEARWR